MADSGPAGAALGCFWPKRPQNCLVSVSKTAKNEKWDLGKFLFFWGGLLHKALEMAANGAKRLKNSSWGVKNSLFWGEIRWFWGKRTLFKQISGEKQRFGVKSSGLGQMRLLRSLLIPILPCVIRYYYR